MIEDLRILFLEDVESDAELAVYHLKKDGFGCKHLRVDNIVDFKNQLDDFDPQVVISDYNLPDCNALEAFNEMKEKLPFIVLSGAIGEEKAVEALKLGVTDYVSKDHLNRLPHVLRRAILEEKMRRQNTEAEQKLKENSQRLELALQGAALGTWDWDLRTNQIVCNERASEIFGLERKEVTTDLRSQYGKIHPDSKIEALKALRAHYMGNSPFFECDLKIHWPDGDWRWVSIKGKILSSPNSPLEESLRASGTIQDINASRLQQEKLTESQQLLHEAHEIAQIGTFEWTLEGGFSHCSTAFYEIFEIRDEDLVTHRNFYYKHVHPEEIEYVMSVFLKNKAGVNTFDLEHRIITKKQTEKVIRSRGQLFFEDEQIIRVVGTVLDVTEQRETRRALYRGQELERQRVAREIHDGIGQMLIATKYKVASVQNGSNETLAKSIEEVEGFLDNVIDETRRISRNLSNRMIDEFGLSGALELLMEEMESISGITINRQIEKISKLSNEVAVSTYRIIQEALNNSIKYAQATKMDVIVSQKNRTIKINVKDNGVGISMDAMKSKGSGLKNMQERTFTLNGHFEINSEPGKGTEIVSWLPISVE